MNDRRIPASWWIANSFTRLSGEAQRVLFCLWTAPDAPTCGLTTASEATLADRLRVSRRSIRNSLVVLENATFIHRDPDSALIWLVGFIEMQLGAHPTKSVKWITATVDALSHVPQTDLVARYRRHYGLPGGVSQGDGGYPTDTLSEGNRYPTDTHFLSSPVQSNPLPSCAAAAAEVDGEVAK